MKKIFSMVPVAALLAACSSNPPVMEERAIQEARSLKAYCANQQIQGEHVKAADALLSSAESRRQAKEKQVLEPAEEAVVRYRLAISVRDLQRSEAEIRQLNEALAQDQQLLDTYKEVLNDVRAMPKP